MSNGVGQVIQRQSGRGSSVKNRVSQTWRTSSSCSMTWMTPPSRPTSPPPPESVGALSSGVPLATRVPPLCWAKL